LTGPDAIAFALADNRTSELASWDTDALSKSLQSLKDIDFDLSAIGFDDDDFLAMTPKADVEGLTDDDAIPDSVETRCKPGDLWHLGGHRLLCGDSTDILQVERLIGGEKADMVFTDPPYGVSYTEKNEFLNSFGTGHRLTKAIENDSMSPDKMNEFWFTALSNAFAVTSNKASYYISSLQGGDLMMMMSIIRAGWQLKHMLIWVKNNHVLGRCDYNYKHEPILYGWKVDGTHEFIGGGRCKTSVWDFPKPLKNDLHPTMKPVDLCGEAILNSSKQNQVVLDLFLGSGSTLIACEKTNRRCFGMEIDAHYCDVIISRWEQFTGKVATLDKG
jgi:DNA modification methylase